MSGEHVPMFQPLPRGCICPPTSERTCAGVDCPRQRPGQYDAVREVLEIARDGLIAGRALAEDEAGSRGRSDADYTPKAGDVLQATNAALNAVNACLAKAIGEPR